MDAAKLMSLRLAREGFGSGDPERVMAMPTDVVFDAWEFINFQNEYEETAHELNRS